MATISVTNTRDSGAGSLRDAIAAATSGDRIVFSSTLRNKTIRLTSGDIEIGQDITIDGSGALNLALSGNRTNRIFDILRAKSVTIKGLNFINGHSVIAGSDIGKGGAIRVHDYGRLVVENSNFKNNVAERGGAIQVGYSGRITVKGSSFDSNDGSLANDGFSAGAIATFGSGVGDTKGFLIIEDTTFTNNKGKNGGAVYSLLGPLDIKNSVFRNNQAGAGGAVFTDGGSVNMLNTRVENNTSRGPGGGLFLWSYQGTMRIEDSIVKGNKSTNDRGGGMRVGPGGSFILRDSTIADNSARLQGGGVWVDSSESVLIEESTFSANSVIQDAGGGIMINTPDGTPVQIKHSTFVDHTSGRDAATIWANGKNSDDVTLTKTVFAGKGSVNYAFKDGGGNVAEKTIGGRPITEKTDKAEYVDDVKLGPLQVVGDRLVHVPQNGSPLIKSGRDIGAYDVVGSSSGSGSGAGSGSGSSSGNGSSTSTGNVFGEYSQLDFTHQWKTVTLQETYKNPVVIVSDSTINGGDPAAIRLRNVEGNQFQIRLQEPSYSDGKHVTESASYMVVEAGDWQLPDGTRLSAGIQKGEILTSQGFNTVNLKGFTETPTVLSQVQTYSGSDWVTTRTTQQSASSFKVAMQEEEKLNRGKNHAQEEIGWFAIDQGTASDGDTLLEGNMTSRSYDHTKSTVAFDAEFKAAPSVIAKLGSYYGGNTANLRLDDIGSNSFGVQVQEEQSLDTELLHTKESVSFLALEGQAGLLTGTSV